MTKLFCRKKVSEEYLNINFAMNMSDFRLSELNNVLREFGTPMTGTKTELITRLQEKNLAGNWTAIIGETSNSKQDVGKNITRNGSAETCSPLPIIRNSHFLKMLHGLGSISKSRDMYCMSMIRKEVLGFESGGID